MSTPNDKESALAVSLPYEIWKEVARYCLTPIYQRNEIRSHPHTNNFETDLLSVNAKIRAAAVDVLETEHLFLHVRHYQCEHTLVTKTGLNNLRLIVGGPIENSAASLDLVPIFGEPTEHPIWRLRSSGHCIPTVEINLRCGLLCSDAAATTLAFIAADEEHLATIATMNHATAKIEEPHTKRTCTQIVYQDKHMAQPQVKKKILRTIDYLHRVIPSVQVRNSSSHSAVESIDRALYLNCVSAPQTDSWPVTKQFLNHYLNELDGLLRNGSPIHELADLIDMSFNRLRIRRVLSDLRFNGSGSPTNEDMLEVFVLLGRSQIMLYTGLAEYLLQREASLSGQNHRILEEIFILQRWQFGHMFWACYEATACAKLIIRDRERPENRGRYNIENASLFLFCHAIVHADTYLEFAMGRVKLVYADFINKRRYELPLPFVEPRSLNSLKQQHIETCLSVLKEARRDVRRIKNRLRESHPGFEAMTTTQHRLIGIIETHVTNGPGRYMYDLDDWGNFPENMKQSVLTGPMPLGIPKLEITGEVLALFGELRQKRKLPRFFSIDPPSY